MLRRVVYSFYKSLQGAIITIFQVRPQKFVILVIFAIKRLAHVHSTVNMERFAGNIICAVRGQKTNRRSYF